MALLEGICLPLEAAETQPRAVCSALCASSSRCDPSAFSPSLALASWVPTLAALCSDKRL